MIGRDLDVARLQERRNTVFERTVGARRVDVANLHSVAIGDADLRRDASAAHTKTSVPRYRRSKLHAAIFELDRQGIAFARKAYPFVTRSALFVVFFWFGVIKLMGVSEATPLALALTTKTVGPAHFRVLFDSLAVFECFIGVLCLIPRAVRLLFVLLFVHMAVVCAPLVLVRELTWKAVLVPTMDGQYIIKNVLIIAAAVGLAAHASPRTGREAGRDGGFGG